MTRSVWSNKTSASTLYHSFLRLPIGRWKKARISVIVEGGSGALVVSSAAIYGDEEGDFASGTVVSLPSTATSQTNDGTEWGAEFATLDAGRQLVDIGVEVKNQSGSKLESGRVTLIVDASE